MSKTLHVRKEDLSARQRFLALPLEKREAIMASMTSRQLWMLAHGWPSLARANQQEPESFRSVKKLHWVILSGRGWGKTATGAGTVVDRVMAGRSKQIALVAQTDSDAFEVMVQAILRASPPWFTPEVKKGARMLLWPNGAKARWYSAKSPSRLRGPQFDFAWLDEAAHFTYPEATYSNLMFGLRLGDAQAMYTTTPLPIKLIRELAANPDAVVTYGASYENMDNLSGQYRRLLQQYEGTRLAEQEIYGKILDDVPGALWTWEMLANARWQQPVPEMRQIVVAVDPAVSTPQEKKERAQDLTRSNDPDETGIVVVGLGVDGYGYVLEDLTLRASPSVWGEKVISAYHRWKADRVVAEKNQGGDLVERNLRSIDQHVPYKGVTATRGKLSRAEPVAGLYEQGRIRHALPRWVSDDGAAGYVTNHYDNLHNQMVLFTPDRMFAKSPDRVDALVWGFTHLFNLYGKQKRARLLWQHTGERRGLFGA